MVCYVLLCVDVFGVCSCVFVVVVVCGFCSVCCVVVYGVF